MRINILLTGEDIWAGRYKTSRRGGKVVRINEPHPVTGKPSLTQSQIAGWPHAVGLGNLGKWLQHQPRAG